MVILNTLVYKHHYVVLNITALLKYWRDGINDESSINDLQAMLWTPNKETEGAPNYITVWNPSTEWSNTKLFFPWSFEHLVFVKEK